MDQQYEHLSSNLQKIIGQMQKIQKNIASDGQPVSMHEVDKLKQLGLEYSETVTQLAQINGNTDPDKNQKQT